MVGKVLREWLPCLLPIEPESQWKTLKVEAAKGGHEVELSYRVIEETGRGTFGTVFKVRTKANEILAMKRIDHRNRHKCREVLTMKSLDHINVVSLHYFCTEGTFSKFRNTIFMEYLPESLHAHISKIKRAKTTLKPLIVSCFTYQLCRGLAHLHHRGIAHRDVKPRNLLVDSSKRVLKICDLGSAKKLDDSDRNITYICSRWYRAPELLFANKNYTVAIDVWSIGCCLAQMIRLEPLFKGRNTADQISTIFKMLGSPTEEEIGKLNVLPEQLPDLSLQRSPTEEILIHDHSDVTERLLLKLLEYDPEKRPTAWAALKDEYFDPLRKIGSGGTNEQALPELFNFTAEELSYPQGDESPESDSGPESPSPSPE